MIPSDNDSHTHFIRTGTCSCGAIKISQLDKRTSWSPVKTWLHTETIIPKEIQQLLLQVTSSIPNNIFDNFPVVCDIFPDKHASYGMAGDLASMIIKTYATIK